MVWSDTLGSPSERALRICRAFTVVVHVSDGMNGFGYGHEKAADERRARQGFAQS